MRNLLLVAQAQTWAIGFLYFHMPEKKVSIIK